VAQETSPPLPVRVQLLGRRAGDAPRDAELPVGRAGPNALRIG
jgi:hypothetical protein